ncbi:hypothetical protein EBZ39_18420 [bacterium]|nr:hypothetical protein [bacterium]
MELNGRKIKWSTIELSGIYHPRGIADAYISYAEFEDGTMLNEDDLEALANTSEADEAIYEIQLSKR